MKPAARPGDPNPDQTVARQASLTQRPEPGEGGAPDTRLGAPKNGQPDSPNPDCPSGPAGCGGAPAVPPNPAPVPSSANSGGGTSTPGSGGAQPGTEDNGWFGSYLKQIGESGPQQPGGLVPKDKAPHSGLDPPADTTTAPFPNSLTSPKPGQPSTTTLSGQVTDNPTLPGLAPLGTPRVVAASTQMSPQTGQILPAQVGFKRPVPSEDSGTGDIEDGLRRLAGAGLVVGGAALTAVSAAGIAVGGVATAGTAGLATPLTGPEMLLSAGGVAAGVGLMGAGMNMATEPSPSAGATPHPQSEEPAAPEAAPAPRPAKPRGTIDESAKKLSPDERRIADTLADEGKNVKSLKEDNDSRTPDTEVDGKPTEFKTLRGKGDNTVKNTLDKSAKGTGQARDIILDARDVELTKDAAELGIARHVGNNPGRYDSIRVIGRDYDFTWHP